jgi:hypothetical protein
MKVIIKLIVDGRKKKGTGGGWKTDRELDAIFNMMVRSTMCPKILSSPREAARVCGLDGILDKSLMESVHSRNSKLVHL